MQSIARKAIAVVAGAAVAGCLVGAASAEKPGGVLRIAHRDSPPSMSTHEESTISTSMPMMGVFNNLVIFDEKQKQNSISNIVPELALSWAWDASKTKLTFKLRPGVKWHDGKPFTANDVQCTWEKLIGKGQDTFRKNPRASWYTNLDGVTVNGELEATFNLKRPQPSFIALLAAGYSPVYPCHVSTRDMRLKPIGTGPFKFVEFKANEYIKVAKNPDYWKKGRPLLDGIDYTIITNRSTAVLALVASKVDMSFPFDWTIPVIKDFRSQAPNAVCEISPTNVTRNLIVNRESPPFDKVEVRTAMMLALDRKSFIDILDEGQADIGAAMQPLPEGVWGMPKEMLQTVPGYGPDLKKNRDEARAIMQKLGYGPDKKLKLKVATRNIPVYRDPAVILIDQLKEIYFDAELEVIETANWHAKVTRKDYQVGLNLTGNGVDDPDQNFYENYKCGSERNFTGYCNPEIDKLFDQQSAEVDGEKRLKLVWAIDKKLQEDGARPIISHNKGGTCWGPQVKGVMQQVNSIYNNWRLEDAWLDK
jgi:peptide/nickel transport system substrate-binding protein